jgi:hypothetical protein
MNLGRPVFAQLMDFLPHREFQRCVTRHKADRRLRQFSCWDQFLCMSFAQLTHRESLRDIESCLRAVDAKLYHLGIRGQVSRSTLAEANESRPWQVYADLAQSLIVMARPLYADEPFGVELHNTVYAFDATTIDLCLSLCPWAPFQRSRGAVKLHTQMDLRGSIPTFIHITHGRSNDVAVMDQIAYEPGAFYLFDRGYVHFKRLYVLTLTGAFFVTRAEKRMQFRRVSSQPMDRDSGVRADQVIRLMGTHTRFTYPVELRRISYYDEETGKRLIFLTNNFLVPALIVAKLYKGRWRIEVFFKWIKQHLRVKKFYGNSENAVKTQIWIAVCVYLLAAIAKKQLGVKASLYTFFQVVGLTVFEKSPILQVFQRAPHTAHSDDSANQLNLFHI